MDISRLSVAFEKFDTHCIDQFKRLSDLIENYYHLVYIR